MDKHNFIKRVFFNIYILGFCALILCNIFGVFADVYQNVEIIIGINPTEKLFDNNESNTIFVSGGGQFLFTQQKPELSLPIFSEEFEILESGEIEIQSKILFVKSAGDGVVKKVGIQNGKKYIEILHSCNIVTRYENLHIVGVSHNYLVMKNTPIASILATDKLVFKIMQNNEILTNFDIVEGNIIWKN